MASRVVILFLLFLGALLVAADKPVTISLPTKGSAASLEPKAVPPFSGSVHFTHPLENSVVRGKTLIRLRIDNHEVSESQKLRLQIKSVGIDQYFPHSGPFEVPLTPGKYEMSAELYDSNSKSLGARDEINFVVVEDSTSDDSVFWTWVAEHGLKDTKFQLTSVPNDGTRGLIATSPIEKDEIVMSVPESLFLSENVIPSTPFGAYLKPELNVTSPQNLIGFLMWCRLSAPVCPWAPFILNLPQESPMTPTALKEEELKEFDGLFIREDIDRFRNEAAQSYALLKDRLFSKYESDFPLESYSEDLHNWAMSMALSRSWLLSREVEESDGSKKAVRTQTMIPVADLANTRVGFGHMNYKQELSIGEITATQAYQPGEEIFIEYGDFSANIHFLIYGFLTTPEDVTLAISIRMATTDKYYDVRKSIAQHFRLEQEKSVVLGKSNTGVNATIPADLWKLAQIINAKSSDFATFLSRYADGVLVTPEQEAQMNSTQLAEFSWRDCPAIFTLENEMLTTRMFYGFIKSKLEGYAHIDEAEYRQISADESLSFAQRASATFALGEKLVLGKFLDMLDNHWSSLIRN